MTKEFRVMCPECGDIVTHQCHQQNRTELKKAILDLLKWIPEGGTHKTVAAALQKEGEKSGWLDKGQDFQKTPFFGAQPWSYALFDKEGGRTFSAYLNNVFRAAGFDPHEIRQEAWRDIELAEIDLKQREQRRDNISKEKKDAIKLFRSKASLTEKIAKLDAILQEKSSILCPLEDDDSGRGGWNHLYKWIKEQYGDGISPEVNRQRIEECRRIAVAAGVYQLHFYGANGKAVFSKRFTSEIAAKDVLRMSLLYDPTSPNALARAVFARFRTNAGSIQTYVRMASGGWIEEPVTVEDPNK